MEAGHSSELEANPLITVRSSCLAFSIKIAIVRFTTLRWKVSQHLLSIEATRKRCQWHFLQDSPFPNFDAVKAEHVVPGISALLTQLGEEIDELERSVTATWRGLIDPLERISDRLGRAWGTISHLKAVKDNEALRKAYEEVFSPQEPLQKTKKARHHKA